MADSPSQGPAQGLSLRAVYTIVCLMMAYILAFVDRTILSLMIDPIRADFTLSDTEVSLLAGLAFALFYAVLGLPMGRIADTSNRRRLIVLGMLAWSVATALCGAVRSASQLFVARVLVGVGEATLTPASYSLIGDLVPRERLGFAMSLYSIGATLGGGLAMVLGGAIVQWALSTPPFSLPLIGLISGWRAAFLVAAIPGVLLAVLMVLTVREPPRRAVAATAPQASLGDLMGHMKRQAWAYTAVLLSYSLVAVTIYAFVIWGPAYFFRVHSLKPVQVGLSLGVILGIGGSVGAILGGFVSDFLAKRGKPESAVIVILATQIAHIPFMVAGYLSGDATTALLLLGSGMFILSAFGGLQHATLQAMTPNRLRGQMAAIYLMSSSLIGLGLGPILTGMLTDQVFGGPLGIGKSLATMIGLAVPPTVVILALALRAIRTAIQDAESMENAENAALA